MTIYSPAQPRDRLCVGEGRRRFDILTIGLHWATVTLIAGMFASAWLLLASDREHAAMLLTVHRSLGVVTWVVAIFRLGWRLSCAYLPPFPQNMPKVQQRLAKASEYGLYALLLSQPPDGLSPESDAWAPLHALCMAGAEPDGGRQATHCAVSPDPRAFGLGAARAHRATHSGGAISPLRTQE
jgi:hypothetical protein